MAHAGARLARPAARAASLLLEEREVGKRLRAAGRRPAGILGAERLSHARRSVDRRTVRRPRTDPTRDQQVPQREQKNRSLARRSQQLVKPPEYLDPIP